MANLRARRLKQMRDEERAKESGGKGSEINPDRGGQRSPVRGRLSRSQSINQDGSDEDEDSEDDSGDEVAKKPVDEYVERSVLTESAEPQHMYPLSILPTTRAQESMTQPVLVIPEGTSVRVPFSGKPVFKAMTEVQMMKGNSSMLNNTTGSGESERLINQNDGKLRGSGEDLDDQTMAMMHAGDSRNSGLYVRESPVWATKLLGTNEPVSESLRDSVDHNMYLARATQRVMRDLQTSLTEMQTRKQWNNEKNGVDAAREGRKGQGRGRGDDEGDENIGQDASGDRSAPPSRLLRQVSTGPVLRIIDDPVNDDLSSVSMPAAYRALGGQLGNWGPDASIKERLGPLNTGDRRNGNRSILRLHVHQISVKDFPLISLEEKKFNDMKSAFAVYRSMFEHQTLPYLTNRVVVVLHELTRLVQHSDELARNGEALEADDLLLLKNLYFDLTESLPLLRELRSSIDTLTANLYDDWKEMKEIRRSAGFIGTKAKMVVKRIDPLSGAKSGFNEGKGEDNEEESEDGGQRSWDELRKSLPGVAELLTNVHALLLEMDLEAAKSFHYGDDINVAEEVAKAMKGPRRPPRNGKPGAAGSGGEESDSVEKMARSPSGRAVTGSGTKAEEIRGNYIRAKAAMATISSDLASTKTLYPEYVVRLSEDGDTTPESQLDSEELNRRSLLQQTSFKCVLKLNGKVVTETKSYNMSVNTLTVDVLQYFEFRVLHQPDSIYVDIYASTPSSFSAIIPINNNVLVASVGVPYPGQSQGGDAGGSGYSKKLSPSAHMFTPVAGWLTFSSDCAMFGNNLLAPGVTSSGALLCAAEYDLVNSEHSHNGDIAHRFDGMDEGSLALLPPRTEGSVGTRWGSRFTMGGGLSSAQLLPTLMSMDPNDPRNSMLSGGRFDAVTTYEDRKNFNMEGNDVAVAFKEQAGADSYSNYLRFKMGPRLQLLRLREMKPHLFSEPIPNTDDEVSKSALYKQILYQNFPDHLAKLRYGDEDEEEAKDVNPSAGLKIKNFLQKVRSSNIAQSRRKSKKKVVTSAAVAETVYFIPPEEPDLSDLLPDKKRSLKPTSQPRTAMTMHVEKCNLLVQVVGARNIPLRSDQSLKMQEDARKGRRSPNKKKGRLGRGSSRGVGSDSEGGMSAESGDDEVAVDESLLDETKLKLRKRAQTCIEVKFQENRDSTVRMPGSAPLWKQSIGLPFRAPGDDYSPSALSQVRDDVYFTLFDEVDEDDAFRGGRMEGEQTTRTERRYLGSFTVPFSTIYSMGRIEGTFRLHTPMFNFGYARAGAIAEEKSGATADIFGGGGGDGDPLAEELANIREPSLMEQILIRVGLLQPEKRLTQEFGQFIHPKTADELEYFASGDGSTYIKILATIDPLLATVPHLPGDVSISSLYHDDRAYGPYAQNWIRNLSQVSQQTRDRPYKCFGMNSEGLQVLISRYLSPLKPPEGYNTMRSVVHLVSMFPYLSDAQSFQEGDIDFWCTSKQAWEIGAGDEEEHGTMLFNYLYYMSLQGNLLGSNNDKKERRRNTESLRNKQGGYPDEEAIRDESVFLVIGEAHPEGDGCYVMVRDRNMVSRDPSAPRNFVLINPITGFVYSAMDPSCPMRNIACIATPYNVWANIQSSGKPHEVSFDLMNIDMWRPFFGRRLPPPSGGMHSVQDEVSYTNTSTAAAVEIENLVLSGIRSGIRRWRSKRSRTTTTYHPDACSIATDMLSTLEQWRKTGAVTVGGQADETDIELLMEEAEKKMTPILRTRTFHGYPINYSFTDVDDVLNKVKALCVHETTHPEVQFVVAAKAFPLFNGTVSLWVFLGVLEANGA
jgi:hypothetical protein